MRKVLLSLIVMLFTLCHTAFSQKIEVTGKVIDDKGNPLQGVSVQEKNSRIGTVTGADGNFKLSTQQGATLLISSVGFGRKEVAVGTNPQLRVVTLASEEASLSEVVVTALGIRREKKALGYAVATVDKKDIELRPDGDVVRLLNGKAPGVDILNQLL